MEALMILFLILINGFFSMAEMAVVSSRPARLETALRQGKRGAQAATRLHKEPTGFLSTVQMGITLVGLLTGIYSGETFTNSLEARLEHTAWFSEVADELSVVIVLVIITFATLILGELVPKRIGLSAPETIARRIAPAMRWVSRIAYPFVWLLTHTSEFIVRLLRLKPVREQVTEEEIKSIVRESTRGGEIRVIEKDIVERVFALGDRTIASLMTIRSEVTFIDITASRDEIIATINRDLHRLYPVIDGDRDRIRGVVYLKDMFTALSAGALALQPLLRPAHFLNEAVSAYNALERFRRFKSNYALVTNEYGMVMGIVTVDDILRGLVGGVYDPAETDQQIFKRSDGTWLVDGEFPLVEFEMHFGLEHTDDDADKINTVAGLVLMKLNQIPRVGERVRWRDFEFEVVDLDNARIDKLLVRQSDA